MQAEYLTVKKIVLFLAAALLIAAPIHAQTLKAGSSQVSIGQVIGCNDSQIVSISTTGANITFNTTVTYASGDPHGGWLYVRDLNTNNVTSGNGTGPITSTVSSAGLNLQFGLNLANQGLTNDTATVTLTSTSPAGQTITIPVTYNPNLVCAGLTSDNGLMSAIPASLVLTVEQGTSQTGYVIITNVSTSTITIFSHVSINSGVTLGTPTITLAPGQSVPLPISASAAGLAPGTYNAIVNLLTQNGGTGIPIAVTVVVTTNGAGFGGPVTAVSVSPASLNFNYVPGDLGPGAQTLQILNSQATIPVSNLPPVPFSVTTTTYSGGTGWLSTNWVPGTTTPFQLKVNVSPLGLKPGPAYQGALVINPLGGTPILVNVTLTVLPPPVISATPANLKFIYTPGGAVPASQTIQVNGAGGPGPFSVAAVGGSWLHVFPLNSATTNIGPVPVTVTVDPTNLVAGNTYTGTVTITGSGPSTGVSNVGVSFTIAGPGITKTSNAASFVSGAVAPGEIISLFGTEDNPIGPETGIALSGDMITGNKLPTTMGGTRVIFQPGNLSAPLLYSSATQVNCQVPYELAGQDNVTVQVSYGGLTSQPYSLNVATTQPGIFTATSTGAGQALSAVYDAKGTYLGPNSTDNPVARGNIITLYVTGEGRTSQPVTGGVTTAQNTAPYTPQPQAYPSVLIDGQPATIAFYGEAPGMVTGMMQVNVIVPAGVRAGPDVLVSIAMGSGYSQAGVTIVTQ